MLKMLKGLVLSPKKQVHYNEETVKTKELSLRPEEGSLTADWIIKNNKCYSNEN